MWSESLKGWDKGAVEVVEVNEKRWLVVVERNGGRGGVDVSLAMGGECVCDGRERGGGGHGWVWVRGGEGWVSNGGLVGWSMETCVCVCLCVCACVCVCV